MQKKNHHSNDFEEKIFLENNYEDTSYHTILKIIAAVIQNNKIIQLISSFLESSSGPNDLNALTVNKAENALPLKNIKDKKLIESTLSLVLSKKRSFVIFGLISFFISSSFLYLMLNESIYAQKRSELVLPPSFALLKREAIVDKMKYLLSEPTSGFEIPTIIISGIGGAGKTTLTRLVAQNHKGLIWEFNASSEQTLKASFRELAYTFAETNEDLAQLNFIRTLTSSAEQDKQILLFVRSKLRKNQGWLLIFDGVASSDIIKTYCPKDSNAWGKGRILITTRDANLIGHHSYNIQLTELSREECVSLFANIRYPQKKVDLNEIKKIQELTNKIPPFPLDIIMAASHISITQQDYELYEGELNKRYIEPDQKKTLNLYGGYNFTRHEIISVSLDKISGDPKYIDLLFLVSLLGPNNIPLDLLRTHASDVELKNYLINCRNTL